MSLGPDTGIASALRRGTSRALGGWQAVRPVDPLGNCREFADAYRPKLDGAALDWEEWPHLAPIYEDDVDDLVLMMGAQGGKSGRILTGIARDAMLFYGSAFGYYFPDFHLPKAFSAQRFAPFLRSAPQLGRLVGKTEYKRSGGQDAVLTRNLGDSTIYFLSTGSRTGTEGLPMVGVYLDELRRMSHGDVMRAMERQSAQARPRNIRVSTAFYPESDIHAAFLAGDQRYFHTACACADGIVLSLAYPDCVVDLDPAAPEFRRKVEHAFTIAGLPFLGATEEQRARWGEAVYFCPRCDTVITNPRDGWWEPHNPAAYAHSYQLPQFLSPRFPAPRAAHKRRGGDGKEPLDVQELWNSMVGLPYVDAEKQPVHMDHLYACVNPDAVWPATMPDRWRAGHVRNTAMGVDAMGGYCCAVVKELTPAGRYRTIHVEVSYGEDPWRRVHQLMQDFDVRVAVADCNPHWNEAHRFALAFRGRVWLATYDSSPRPDAPMVVWRDRTRRKGEETAKEAGFKWMVRLHRTKILKWSLKRWAERLNECPPPDGLLQRLPTQKGQVVLTPGLRVGEWRPVSICREVYWLHLQRVAFERREVTEEKRRTGIVEEIAVHVGIDPHFAHANAYADVALARMGAPRQPMNL